MFSHTCRVAKVTDKLGTKDRLFGLGKFVVKLQVVACLPLVLYRSSERVVLYRSSEIVVLYRSSERVVLYRSSERDVMYRSSEREVRYR